MNAETIRTQDVMPKATLDDIDALVGRRARSSFLAEAAEEKLRRVRQRAALDRVAGSLKDANIPGWETPEAASAWVARMRAEADARPGS